MPEPPTAARRERLRLALGCALLAAFTIFFARHVVQYFGGPILAAGDMGVYGFTSFYFSRNLTWLPVPHLRLVSDWTFYPYGVDHVFLHWCFERDVLYTVCHALWGSGPWFQVYFLLSIALTAFGAVLVLRRYAPPLVACGLAFALSFGNYYVVRKFPWQQPYACVHWTTLGILLDYVLVRRAWEREPWSARLLLARLAILLLGLGQDLGYVAGFSLLSLTLTLAWVACLFLARTRNRARPAAAAGGWRQLATTWRARRLQCSLLAVLALVGAWLYVPLSYQVASAAGHYDFTRVPQEARWEHPLRLLVPQLPGIDEASLRRLFADRGEGSVAGHFRPGLAFVLAAVLGLVYGRRRWAVVLPLLAMLALLVAFRPEGLPTLHAFPWFRHARVPGRATLVLPTLLALLALGALPALFRRRSGRVAALLVVVLFAAETATVYREVTEPKLRFSRRRTAEPYYVPEPALLELARKVRQTPGEALLEWPFSVSTRGGRFGTFRHYLAGVFVLAELHEKKLMGAYFGRLHPDQLEPLRRAGWANLFLPHGTPRLSNDYESAVQRRDFVAKEWRFLRRFFAYNDFAGILLYPDLLPPETVAGFHRRFGRPVAEARFPGPGRIQFIPKPAALRRLLDPPAGRRLRIAPPVLEIPLREPQIFRTWDVEDYLRAGWSKPESKLRRRARWILRSRAAIAFRLADPSRPTVFVVNLSGHPGVEAAVRLNGTVVQRLLFADDGEQYVHVPLPADLLRARNLVEFRLARPRGDRSSRARIGHQMRVWWIRVDQPAE